MKAILISILVTFTSIGIIRLCHGCYQCSHSSTSDPSPISDTSQVNRILNKYASRANSTINRSASINIISFFFDNIDANLVKLQIEGVLSN